MTLKLKHKLMLLLAATAVIPLTVATFQSLRTFKHWAAEENRQELNEQFRVFGAFSELRKESVLQDLVRFANDPEVSAMLADKSESSLLTRGISQSEAMGADAFYFASEDESLVFEVVQQNWGDIDPGYDFHVALALSHQSSASLMLDPEFGLGTVASTPVKNRSGNLVGAAVVFVPFSAAWMTNLKDITNFDFTVLTSDRHIVSTTLPPGLTTLPLLTTEGGLTSLRTIEFFRDNNAAEEWLLTDISSMPVATILITQPLGLLLLAINAVTFEIAVFAGAALLFALLLGLLFSRQITNPVAELLAATKRIANQDYEADFAMSSNDEFGQLADSFSVMALRLRETTDSLAAGAHELELRVEERTAELRAAQTELVRNERLATVGQMTATVSHELRNPLGAIRSASDAITKIAGGSDPQLDRAIALLERSQVRCDIVIADLLNFSRVQELNRSATSIDDWLREFLDDYQFPPSISLHRDLRAGIEIAVDRDRLERAVRNIIENGCHALQADGEEPDAARSRQLIVASRATNQRLEISIKDNGPGIAAEDQASIFEPLYSTKSVGVGLGLPIVKQILEQHEGGVELGSDVTQGAEFVLWIPRNKPEERTFA